jgi:hypothetical protein
MLNIFESGWQKIAKDPIGWGALLLFAIGVIVLLTLMGVLPYVSGTS